MVKRVFKEIEIIKDLTLKNLNFLVKNILIFIKNKNFVFLYDLF